VSSDIRSPRCGAAFALLAALTPACGLCLFAVYLAPLPLRAGVACAAGAAAVVLCAAVTTAAYHAMTSRLLRERLRTLGDVPRPEPGVAVPGPLVPRQRSAAEDVDLVSLVVSTGEPDPRTPAAQATVLRACRAPVAVAELAARLRLPVCRTRALVGELAADGRVAVRPPGAPPGGDAPCPELLARVLDGLRAL
jgi:uncharacterized protein DUF742